MVLRMAVAVGLLIYLTISGAIDWPVMVKLISNWPITLLALLVSVVFSLVQAERLALLLRPQGMYLPLYASFKLTLIGLFFNSCLPGATGGDAIKIYYAIEGNHGRRTEIATLIMFDRVVGMFALLILPVLVAPLFPKLYGSIKILRGLVWISATVAFVMGVIILLCFINRIKNSRLMVSVFEKLPLGNYIKRMFDTLYNYRHNKATLLKVVGISLLVHAMNIGIILFLSIIINPLGLRWEMSLLIPLGFLATTLPVTPGGIGVGEAAFNKLFIIAGLSGGAELLLGWRLLAIVVGLSGLAFYLQGRKRFVRDSNLIGVSGRGLRSFDKN
jgi:uncharacterized protein (TIRG00374 family)